MIYRLKQHLALWALLLGLFLFSDKATSKTDYVLRSQQAPLLVLSVVRDVPIVELEFMFRVGSLPFNFGIIGASTLNRSNDISNLVLGKDDDAEYEVKSYNLGIRTDLPFNGNPFTDGFYYSFAVMGGSYTSSEKLLNTQNCTNSYKSEGISSTIAMTTGYQWFWSTGYHIMLGAGFFESSTNSSKVEFTNTCGGVQHRPDEGNTISPLFDLAFGISL